MRTHWALGWIIIVALGMPVGQAAANQLEEPGLNAYDLIAAVNQLRAANGLYAYTIQASLMNAAYSHSEYQASLGTWSHEGYGGTDETQRAIAAGYGGTNVRCDENVAYGYNLSSQAVLEMWMGPAHLANMLSTRYVDAGAGAYTDGNGRTYFTLVVCVSSASAAPQATVGAGTAFPTAPPLFAVETATPNADGTIIHIVQEGQTLIGIAEAYAIPLDELLALNQLRQDAPIYPQQELIIAVVGTATATAEPSQTATVPAPTSTRRPTRTPTQPAKTPTATQAVQPSQTLQPTAQTATGQDAIGDVLLAAIAVMAVLGVGLVIAGGLLRRG